ncbi:MAG TPA: protein kinase [Pyrinomonadaceae bacterium]|nr:protein kinase [Pyrinomonadaceae bacterium]
MEESTISHYRIIEKLGAGGMGEVYLAEDLKLGRKVAIKLLSQEYTTNRERLHRFEQEACAASSLNHPNILTIYEVGVEDGRHFMATEYIDGNTLRQKLRERPLTVTEVLDIAIQIASALDEAHAAGIVHRDIKPDNVMVRRNSYVKVLDFGLAKLTERVLDRSSLDAEAATRVLVQTDAGVVMGTSHYMSPEQARAQAVDARTDIWSLGVVMYEMTAGKAPFTGETPTDVIVAITQQEPPPLARFTTKLPAELEWIVTKALRKDREERYQTAKELLTDLRRLKQRLEFEAELERSATPEQIAAMTTITDHGSVPTLQTGGAAKTDPTAPHHVSSAEYIVSEIKKRKKGASLVAALFVIAIGLGTFFYFNRAQALTDKDTILLADFVNTTGETVFDDTLEQALAVQLGQTPFLNILPDDRVRQTLRFMGRSPDERITRDIGMEICQRQGIKALLVGSIAALGSHYVISLEALNAQTGDTLARDQIEAESKEQVLSALSTSAWRLREKLGESLSTMKQFAVPIDQATTSSLEALKAYATGNDLRSKGQHLESAPFYRRAVQLDPNFAMAHARLAVFHGNLGELGVAQQHAERAYELRDRVSEHERFYISEKYHNYVTGDIDKAIEVLKSWAKTYPNDFVPHNNLALNYNFLGQLDDALREAIEAARLDPRNTTARGNLVEAFFKAGRHAEAEQALRELQQLSPDADVAHFYAFNLALAKNDQAAIERELAWAKGKPIEPDFTGLEALNASVSGKFKRAKELVREAVNLYLKQERKENAAQVLSNFGVILATIEQCKEGQANASEALSLNRGRVTLANAAAAAAVCGDAGRAQTLIDELLKQYPNDTAIVSITIPAIRAQLERNKGNRSEAIRLLESVSRFDLGTVAGFTNNYLRGLLYLEESRPREAEREFQRILDARNLDLYSHLYALAQLSLARAAAQSGDTGKSRIAYQNLFSLWRDADRDLKILQQAKKEYEQIK